MEKAREYPTAVLLNDFRKRVFEIFADIAGNPSRVVPIKRRTDVSAFLVSSERFAPLLDALEERDQERSALQSAVWLVVERWLHGAPAHLREPQMRELAELEKDPILALLFADPKRSTVSALEKLGVKRTLAERLLKRHRMARAIAAAEHDALYEAVDHKSGTIE